MKRLLCTLVIASFLIELSAHDWSQIPDTIFLKLTDTIQIPETFFNDNSLFSCTLKCDLKEYQRTKNEENYINAELIYPKDSNTVYNKKVRIKSRGINRKEICALPPYWLSVQKVKKDEFNFDIHQKFKVVSHCSSQKIFESYVLKEYLIYRMYNQLTPYSFKVRLAKITYIDTGRKDKTSVQYAIFIEPVELLTKRLNAHEIKTNNYSIYHTEETTTDLLCMFAYMIGNTDWSVAGRHNIKLIVLNQQLIPVPYDFDYAGLVNAYYAKPREGFGLENVRERAYFGPCRDLIKYTIAAQSIKNKKGEFSQLIETTEELDKSIEKDILLYLNEFFINIKNPEYIKYHIDPNCYEPEDFN